MNCFTCPELAGYVEPVPGKDTVRPVCAMHRTAEAQFVNPADLMAAALFGASVPWAAGPDEPSGLDTWEW